MSEKADVKNVLIFSEYSINQSDEGACERRVLGHFMHGHGPAVPVHFNAIRVPPPMLHLAGGPDEERIINVDCFVGERQEAGQRDNCQHDSRMT